MKFVFKAKQDDFDRVDLIHTLEKAENKTCESYYMIFRARLDELEDGKLKDIYILLFNLSWQNLRLDKSTDPFPDSAFFNEEHIDFLTQIVDQIPDAELSARILDLLWVKKRDFRAAEKAVTFYVDSANNLIDEERWFYTVERYERAFQLASTLNNMPLIEQRVVQISGILDRIDGNDPLYLSLELMRLLQERRKGDAQKYSSLSEKLAISSEREKNFEKARRSWNSKAEWGVMLKNDNLIRDAKLKIAETYENEAQHNIQTHSLPYSMASHCIERAIVAYRNAGNSIEKVEELKLTLRKYQNISIKEHGIIPLEGIDVSDIVQTASTAVSEKTFTEAISIFARLARLQRKN